MTNKSCRVKIIAVKCSDLYLNFYMGCSKMARTERNELKGNYFHIIVRGLTELNIVAEHKLKLYDIGLLS